MPFVGIGGCLLAVHNQLNNQLIYIDQWMLCIFMTHF